jgi:hypothetical protein
MESMSKAKDLLRRREVRRVGASVLGGFILGLPLAAMHSVSHTEVNDNIATIPSKLSLAPSESRIESGLLFGTVYDDGRFSKYGMGVAINIQEPPAMIEDISETSPEALLQPFINYYSQPSLALEGSRDTLVTELKSNFKQSELLHGSGLSVAVFTLLSLTQHLSTRKRLLALSPLLAMSVGGTVSEYNEWQNEYKIPQTYAISGIQDTNLSGLKTNSPTTAQLIDLAVPYIQRQVERLDEQRDAFDITARQSIETQLTSGAFQYPNENEKTVLITSDMHSNLSMIHAYTYLVEAINASQNEPIITTMFSAGDQTYGSAAEKVAIDRMAKIADNVVAINGNHDGEITDKNQQDAGIKVLHKPTEEEVDGLTVLGVSDPSLTKLGALLNQKNVYRESGKPIPDTTRRKLQQATGKALANIASSDETMPDLIMTHEGLSIGPLVGQNFTSKKQVDEWMNRSTNEMSDVAGKLTVYGHWHPNSSVVRIVKGISENYAVIQLGSSGGASAQNRFNSFSTPSTPPIQQASATLATYNADDVLMRLQEVTTDTDGVVVFQPPIEVNSDTIEQ